jgi:hypothetical protein
MSDLIVTMRDVRESGLCARGTRAWFARRGLDFHKFLTEGMPEAEVIALQDALANRALDAARNRKGEKQ